VGVCFGEGEKEGRREHLLQGAGLGGGRSGSLLTRSSPLSGAGWKWRTRELTLVLAVGLQALPTCVTPEGSVYVYFN